MGFEWDPRKADSNFAKHGVRFSESLPVFDDDYSISAADEVSGTDEQRVLAIGTGTKYRVLAVVYCFRGDNIRIISARVADPNERKLYEDNR